MRSASIILRLGSKPPKAFLILLRKKALLVRQGFFVCSLFYLGQAEDLHRGFLVLLDRVLLLGVQESPFL